MLLVVQVWDSNMISLSAFQTRDFNVSVDVQQEFMHMVIESYIKICVILSLFDCNVMSDV